MGYVRVQKNIFRVALHRLWTLGGLGFMIFFIIRLYQATRRDAMEWIHSLATHVVWFYTCDIPGGFQAYKHKIREMAGARRSNNEVWYGVGRSVRGIQETGIAVGGFYYIEKTSTGDFVGFIIDQVVGLLVAYPKPIVIPE